MPLETLELNFGSKTLTFHKKSEALYECVFPKAFPDSEFPDLVLEILTPLAGLGLSPYWARFRLQVRSGRLGYLPVYVQAGNTPTEALNKLHKVICCVSDVKTFLSGQ